MDSAPASVAQIFDMSPREEWHAELRRDGTYECHRKIETLDSACYEHATSALDAVAFFAAGREAAYFPARDFVDALDDKVIPDQSSPDQTSATQDQTSATQPFARSEPSWTPSSY